MLGLERVLSEKPPHLASGTELRRHQVDALAGMLTELIAAAQKTRERQRERRTPRSRPRRTTSRGRARARTPTTPRTTRTPTSRCRSREDPGAVRRYRFRHPTASGKTIAAAGFVEAARTEGVLILTHRRLLVDQFRRELDRARLRRAASPTRSSTGHTAPRRRSPITIQTYAWFARHVDEIARDAYQLVICDEAHTALGEKTSAAIRRSPSRSTSA